MFDLESFRETAANLIAAVGAAFIGRFARHALLVQRGSRKFWGVHLVLELPVAIFMGFVGNGLADWLLLSQKSSIGLVAVLSYLGPVTLEHLLTQFLERNIVNRK